FGRGYGRDTIVEAASWIGSNDTLSIKAGIAVADVVVVRIGNDLELRLKGSDDRVRIVGQATAAQPPINQVAFADGTQWTAAQLLGFAVAEAAADAALNPTAASPNPFTDPLFQLGQGPVT